jgi:hypothetical protein
MTVSVDGAKKGTVWTYTGELNEAWS